MLLLLLYESWRCHHNDNLTKDSWMAFTILIFESDMRIKYRLWRQWPFNEVFIFTSQVSDVAQELSLSILAPPCCSFFFFTEQLNGLICLQLELLLIHCISWLSDYAIKILWHSSDQVISVMSPGHFIWSLGLALPGIVPQGGHSPCFQVYLTSPNSSLV